jgi:branched-chain amino acid transport system permease protein
MSDRKEGVLDLSQPSPPSQQPRKKQSIRDRWETLPGWQKVLGLIAFIAFLYYLPLFGIPGLNYLRTDAIDGGTSWAGTLFTCAIYVIIAIGLNVVIGLAGLLDLGYVGFFAIGAYSVGLFGSPDSKVVAWLRDQFNLSQDWAVSWAVCIPIAIALTMISGVMLGWPTLRLRGDYLAIVTLGFGEIIRLVFNNAHFLGGATGYSGDRALGLPVYTNFFWVATWSVLVIWLIGNLTYSSYGRALRAIREDEIAAEAVGIPTTRYKVLAFVISSASAGIAGGLFAHLQSTIRPDDFKFDRSIDMIVMIIVGGLGSVTGAVFGAIFVGITLELSRDLQQYRLVAYALMLVLLMLFRPQGILGKRELFIGKLLGRFSANKGATP